MDIEFQSTLSLRRATNAASNAINAVVFQSTLSLRRATGRGPSRPLGGRHFNPRSPCGERLTIRDGFHFEDIFQSTLSLRRATDFRPGFRHRCGISIHALLAESDVDGIGRENQNQLFQSTLSLRRATPLLIYQVQKIKISIHALLAESDSDDFPVEYPVDEISIHALLAESDVDGFHRNRVGKEFQSTLSLRRATILLRHYPKVVCISIHALLAESDPSPGSSPGPPPNFNPRSPCGERPMMAERPELPNNFNPRSPCGERLQNVGGLSFPIPISIHALLAESDRCPR